MKLGNIIKSYIMSLKIQMTIIDPISILSAPFAQPSLFGTSGLGGVGGLGFLLAIILLVVVRRIMYAVHGRRFSRGRVLSLPVIYLFLTFVTLIPLEYLNPVALLSLLAIPVGFVAGYMFGKQVSFFNKDGVLYFKRSPVILILWLISYITRIVLVYLLGSNFDIVFTVDSILALTSGLILGEAIRVLKGHSQHVSKPAPEKEEEFDLMKEIE